MQSPGSLEDMRTLNWISFGCASAASLFLAAAVTFHSPRSLPIVFLPPLLAAAPLAFIGTGRIRTTTVVMFLSALGLTGLWLLGLLSVGWFYFPSAMFMVATLFSRVAPGR